MRIGVHSATNNWGSIETVRGEIGTAVEHGLASYWMPTFFGHDALSLIASFGPGTNLGFGTAVVPTAIRNVVALAQQVATTQELVGGRLTLGVGPGHEAIVRNTWRQPWHPPIAYMTEYLAALTALLRGEAVDVDGEYVRVNTRLAAPLRHETPVLLGTVAPAMTGVAIRSADGVVLWSAGLRTLAEVTMPRARDAANPGFRVVVALPLCVTSDETRVRAEVAKRLGANDRLPSYQRVLEREQCAGVADLAVVGSAAQVEDTLAAFAAVGVTEFAAHVIAPEPADADATWQFLSTVTKRF